jgi:hypothetical protein
MDVDIAGMFSILILSVFTWHVAAVMTLKTTVIVMETSDRG